MRSPQHESNIQPNFPHSQAETENLQSETHPQINPSIAQLGSILNSTAHAAMLQRSPANPGAVLQLQRHYGNRYVNRVLQQSQSSRPVQIQAKLILGAVGDKYEQEADRIAKQVVNQINLPASQPLAQSQSIQRQETSEEDNELMMQLAVNPIQRQEITDEEDERLLMKPVVQRQSSDAGSSIPTELEASINQAKGKGQPLPAVIREPMEQALNADFSDVKIHTDSRSDQLNQSIQAKAFTTGKDILFRQGEYNPGSRVGQELIAHELTHVIQQNAETQIVNRKPSKSSCIVKHSTNGDRTVQAARTKLADVAGLFRNILFGSETKRRDMQPKGYINLDAVNTQAVSIVSTNGNTLTGDFFTPKAGLGAANTTVLFLSGSGGSTEKYRNRIVHEYITAGAQVLAVNYRGFGGSYQTSKGVGRGGGEPTEAGLYEDALAMYNYLIKQGIASNDIIVHGYSLGAPIAATLVKRVMKKNNENVKGLILDRAMTSTKEAASIKAGSSLAGGIGQLFAGSMDTKEKLQKILSLPGGQNLPLLFTSGGGANDPKTPQDEVLDDLSDADRALAQWAQAQNNFNNAVSLEDRTAGHFDQDKFMALLIPELQKQNLL